MRNIEAMRPMDKNAKDDRVITLQKKKGEHTKTNTGMVDNRLFTGENKLHAVFEGPTCLWYLKYEQGALPEPLKDKRFTSFRKAVDAAEHYFGKRGIEITKIEE